MPFTHTCRDHDDFEGDALDQVLDHLDNEHPGVTFESARSGGLLQTTFVSQTVAQGTPPLRVYRCRACGTQIETRDADPPERCADCQEVRA